MFTVLALLLGVGLQVNPSTAVCPPLTSQTVLISCSWAGETVDCSQPQQISTEATLDCKPGFALPIGVGHYRKITCLRSGLWSNQAFSCIPDCGRRHSNEGKPLISNWTDAKIGEFPWHVGIYQVLGTGNTAQICGGSLITPQVVVTAAHCFWSSSTRSQNDARNYKVAAGKHLRAWDDPDSSVQKRNVSEIVLHEWFRGQDGGFGSDIALLHLESPVDINPRVNLVCVDWGNRLEESQLTTGSSGVVAGWGYSEDGVQSDTLKYVDLPFVTFVTCLDSLPPLQQPLLTIDKICAGFVNQSTSVCGGDSGGGLVFRHSGSDKYYLRGIVSISFKPFASTAVCYSQHYTAFTKMSHYIPWVQDHNNE